MSQNHPISPVEDTAQDWFLRLTSGEVSDADLEAFKTWRDSDPRHLAAFEEIRDLWNDLEDLAPAFAASSDKAGEATAIQDPDPQVSSKVVQLDQRRPSLRTGRRIVLGGLVAACLLILGVFSRDIRTAVIADFQTGVGEQVTMTLPDGSTAHLNTDSAIALDFTEDRRDIVLLQGEALFEVQKDAERPFNVKTLGGRSTAIGTTYAVRKAGDNAIVSVMEGRVRVTSPEKAMSTDEASAQQIELSANQQVSYQRGAAPGRVISLQSENIAAWRRGLVLINARPFSDAIEEIDRYRPGRILVIADSGQIEPVTARIRLEEIDGGLTALATLNGLAVTRVTDYLTILH